MRLDPLERLDRAAAVIPDVVATELAGMAVLTYGNLAHRSNALAGRLRAAGAGPGTTVAVVADETQWCDLVVATYACLRAGAAVAPLSASLPPEALAEALNDLAPVVAVVPGGRARLPARLSGLRVEEPAHAAADAAAALAPAPDPDVSPEDVAQVVRTSGTTGRPKLVAATYAELAAADDPVDPPEAPTRERPIVLMTISVGTDATQNLVRDVVRGPLLLVPPRFDAVRYSELLSTRRPLVVGLVPSTAQALLRLLSEQPTDTSSVRTVVCSSAPLALATFDALARAFPRANVLNAFALSEGVGLVNEHRWGRTAAVGRRDATVDVRIVRDGVDVPEGEVGEIWLRRRGAPPRRHLGPVAPDFVASPVTTIRTDGWVATADLGRIDGDGFVYFVDRADDIAVVGGHLVSTLEVEEALLRGPGVTAAAAVRLPHTALGHIVAAVVTGVDEAGVAAVAEAAAAVLPAHKRPRPLVTVAELPLTPNGKIRRDAVRAVVEQYRANVVPALPGVDLVENVRRTWASALDEPGLRLDVDLFDAGGFSLLGGEVAAQLSTLLDRRVPLALVLEHRTPADLALALTDAVASGTLAPSPVIKPRRRGTPSVPGHGDQLGDVIGGPGAGGPVPLHRRRDPRDGWGVEQVAQRNPDPQ